jgi:hypothetical protein
VLPLDIRGRSIAVFGPLALLACGSPNQLPPGADAAQETTLASADDSGSGMGFAQQIFPILLQAGCGECHSPERMVASHWAVTTPSDTYRQWIYLPGLNHCDSMGQPISAPQPEVRLIPGDPDGSLVVKKLTAPWEMCGTFFGHMPPSPRPRLPVEQIDLIRAWITAGAPP